MSPTTTTSKPGSHHVGGNREQDFETLHSILNHCGEDKLRKTLQHTTGVTCTCKSDRKDAFCDACAQAKAKRKGLCKKTDTALPEHEICEDALNVSTDFEHEICEDALNVSTDFEADTPGTILPVLDHHPFKTPESLHRYDVTKLKPFEVMYVDNKNYPCTVRGGNLVAFVLVDLRTFAIFKVDVTNKARNGRALREILSSEGVHKLPYKCTVYADNCGSMSHVASTLGVLF